MEMEKQINVAAGLVFRDGRVLITRRPADAHLGGLWEFPGGKREEGESGEQCIVRELREELGIDIEPGEILESLTHAYPEKVVRLTFFRCRWKAHEPRPLGCAEFRWVRADELQSYDFPAADERLLERLCQSPELWR